MSKALPVPVEAQRDPKSVEMMRSWIAEGRLFTVINVGHWERPDAGIDERDAWGIVMADMVRHIANAHEEEYGRDPGETLIMIREAFEREIANPTTEHSGEFGDGKDSPTL